MNETLLSFLEGRLEAESFTAAFQSDDALKDAIRALIPEEAKEDQTHPLWTRLSYSALRKNSFDYYKYLKNMCSLSGTISDNFNLFGSLKNVCGSTIPNIHFTKIYDDRFDLYLETVGDRFEGPEVEEIVEKIIEGALSISPKAARKKAAREMIKETFHVTGTYRPRWIQGAEWPMGKNSPMAFQRQERKGERMEYFFRDVDTGEERVIGQFY